MEAGNTEIVNTEQQKLDQQQTQEEQKNVRPEYTGDKGEVQFSFERDTPIETKPIATFSYGKRIRIQALTQKFEEYVDHIIQVAGWARTTRMGGKDFAFIELTDGSGSTTLQVVVDSAMPNFAEIAASKVGASFKIKGKLIKSPAKGQLFELQVCCPEKHACQVIGQCDGSTYPLPTKRHTNEYLREHANLRPRTKLISAITRIRNNLAYATHKFFQERGFLYIHTPLITASDCEGAGEMFQVTTVLPKKHDDPIKAVPLIQHEGQEHEEEKKDEKPLSKNAQKKLAKKKGKDGAETEAQSASTDTTDKNEVVAKEEEKVIPFEDRKINYKKDFFGKPAFLTVSGQLSVENYACGMGDVYTFGPTFRAENSNTTRHLAEFWMIEPEIVFADINDVMDLAEDYVKYCIRYVIANNVDDLDFFNEWIDKGLKARLENVTSNVFKRLSYTDAIALLEEHVKDKKVKFLVKPEWGMDMGSEHERYLAEKVFQMPVCVYNYPKTFKAFYMRRNDDGKTVAAMDMLVPGIGELIGGSQREERLDQLDAAILEKGLEIAPYWWYRESRMYGTQPHGGFGLGFERLVMMCTGVENIRDVIPFPRYPGNAEF